MNVHFGYIPPSSVEEARCNVLAAEELINQQKRRIEALRSRGFPTDLAESLLASMLKTLALFRNALAMMETDSVQRDTGPASMPALSDKGLAHQGDELHKVPYRVATEAAFTTQMKVALTRARSRIQNHDGAQHHRSAAEHLEIAAKHHLQAAEQHESGAHEEAASHARSAYEALQKAMLHATQAAEYQIKARRTKTASPRKKPQ